MSLMYSSLKNLRYRPEIMSHHSLGFQVFKLVVGMAGVLLCKNLKIKSHAFQI